ncbi:MAG: hypothetical protein OXI33_13005, partial [Chloroflexota bacterium]|nr:hypothetical protein [Chloroflexota bacterium]
PLISVVVPVYSHPIAMMFICCPFSLRDLCLLYLLVSQFHVKSLPEKNPLSVVGESLPRAPTRGLEPDPYSIRG